MNNSTPYGYETSDDPCAASSSATELDRVPGQTALTYRVGTHATFRAAMLAALHSQEAVRDLTARAADDPTVALVDAWAMTLDVLSFYQERIANEGFLHTATETRSVRELARMVGYELDPGVASETYVAFTLEEGSGSPTKVQIQAGAQVQSVPGPGERPQVFETIEPIEARPMWNRLSPPLTKKHKPQAGESVVYLDGVALGLRPGDALLFVGHEREKSADDEHWDVRFVDKLTVDAAANRTAVTLNEPLGWSCRGQRLLVADDPKVFALRLRAALFGHNAPDWKAMPNSVKRAFLGEPAGDASPTSNLADWPNFSVTGVAARNLPVTSQSLGLTGRYFEFRLDGDGRAVFPDEAVLERVDAQIDFDWGSSPPDPRLQARFMVRWRGSIIPPASGLYRFYTISDDGVRLWVANSKVLEQWSTHGVRLDKAAQAVFLNAGEPVEIRLEYFNSGGNGVIRMLWENETLPLQIVPHACLFPSVSSATPNIVHLDAYYPQVRPGGWLVLSAPTGSAPGGSPQYVELYQVADAEADARANFNLSARTTRVALRGENLAKYNALLRETLVLAQDEQLALAEVPIWDTTTSAEEPPRLELIEGDRIPLAQPVVDLAKGRPIFVGGITLEGKASGEVVFVDHLDDGGGTLVLQGRLSQSYRRESVAIAANLARATHGETRHEILGSGDAAQANQHFVLREAPLTFLRGAALADRSTLQVRVDAILWQEVSSLYEAGPEDRVYMVRINDDQRVVIQFGDGIHGARLSTGRENVSATYRVGTGIAGMLDTGQLRVLLTRPLGVEGVTNPLATSLAAEPEELASARRNAPRTSLTLDRIVTVRDVEDYARSYGGIGKALAVWAWDGRRKLVHLTVAGAGGRTIDARTLQSFRSALARVCDPALGIRVTPSEPLRFRLKAKLLVERSRRADLVIAGVRRALGAAFGFEARDFDQRVTRSEVIGVIQGVDGVEMVDLDELCMASSATSALYESLPPRSGPDVQTTSASALAPAVLLVLADEMVDLREASA